jgi:hypothetical protein
MTGVSTDINATFVKPGGKLGDTMFMETRVTGIGEPYLCLSWNIRRGLSVGRPFVVAGEYTSMNTSATQACFPMAQTMGLKGPSSQSKPYKRR